MVSTLQRTALQRLSGRLCQSVRLGGETAMAAHGRQAAARTGGEIWGRRAIGADCGEPRKRGNSGGMGRRWRGSPPRWMAACAGAVGCLAVLAGMGTHEASAQTSTTLISNTGQLLGGTDQNLGSVDFATYLRRRLAQPFRTGPEPLGYTIDSVTLDLDQLNCEGRASGFDILVEIAESVAGSGGDVPSNVPGDADTNVLHRWTITTTPTMSRTMVTPLPATYVVDATTGPAYTAPKGAGSRILSPNTRYFVVMRLANIEGAEWISCAQWRWSRRTAVDDESAAGWTLSEQALDHHPPSGMDSGPGVWQNWGDRWRFSLQGSKVYLNKPVIRVDSSGPQDGTARVGDTLEVNLDEIVDDQGVMAGTFSYLWYREANAGDAADSWDPIYEATGPTFTPGVRERGKKVGVRVWFSDNTGRRETRLSELFPADSTVAAAAAADNMQATGVTVSGLARVGATLRADISGLTDADGLGSPTYTYQWYHTDPSISTNAISGATSSTYVVASGNNNQRLAVVVSFTDAKGNMEEVASALTSAVGASLGTRLVVSVQVATVGENQTNERREFRTSLYRSGGCSNAVIRVDYTIGGTATRDIDYGVARSALYDNAVPMTGTLVFPRPVIPGGTQEPLLHFRTMNDSIFEGDETVTLTFENMRSDAVGCDSSSFGIANGFGELTITDDDQAPLVEISSSTTVFANVPDTGVDETVIISLRKTGDTALPASVPWGLDYDRTSAVEGVHFRLPSGPRFVDFAPGDTTAEIVITLIGTDVVSASRDISLIVGPANDLLPPVNARVATFSNQRIIGVNLYFGKFFTAVIDSPSVEEGASGETNLDFTVSGSATGSGRVPYPMQIKYVVDTASTATSMGTGSDKDYEAPYSGAFGLLDFPAYSTEGVISVAVRGDTVSEPDETVVIRLTEIICGECPSGQLLGVFVNLSDTQATGTGTILSDDNPSINIDSVQVAEGNAGTTTPLAFTVSLSRVWTQDVMVDYAIADETALSSGNRADYSFVPPSEPLTIPSGEMNAMITVTVNGDNIYENDETFTVTLSNPVNGLIDTGIGRGTITNDERDPPFVLSGPSQPVDEGNQGTTDMVFTLTRLSGSDVDSAIFHRGEITTPPATVSRPLYFGGEITFPAGEAGATLDIPVQISGDMLPEPDETVEVILSSATPGGVRVGRATGTIRNDDFLAVSVDSLTVDEGASGTSDHQFTVTLGAIPPADLTVEYTISDGTASSSGSDIDYSVSSTSGTLTFTADTTTLTQAIPFTVNGDTALEISETFTVTLSNVQCTGCPTDPAYPQPEISTATGTATIRNDDGTTVTVQPASVVEGNAATSALRFTVQLDAAYISAIDLEYSVADGTATAGVDYVAPAGPTPTLNIPQGETSGTIDIVVNGDTVYETDETLELTLSLASMPIGLSLDTATVMGTIQNDDDPPELSIAAANVDEGDAGTTDMVFTVTKSGLTALDAEVSYALSGTGTATSGTDYEALAGGSFTFLPSETTKTFSVAVTGDTLAELDETILAALSSPVGASIASGGGEAAGTIRNDDILSLSIGSTSVREGNTGDTPSLIFTVTVGALSSSPVTVGYSVTGGTATADEDYTALPPGMLTIAADAAGTTTGTITVQVIGDRSTESNETVEITLASPTCTGCPQGIVPVIATGQGVGVGTITDDDGAVISIDSPEVLEGQSGQTAVLRFTVSLGGEQARQDITLGYSVTGGTATPGEDYEALPDGALFFSTGSTLSQTILVTVLGDSEAEGDETIVITLTDQTEFQTAIIDMGVGTGTILSDDRSLSIAPASSVLEGLPRAALHFTVALSHAHTADVAVGFSVADTSTATVGADYTMPADSSVTIPQGQTSAAISFPVLDDLAEEVDEFVDVEISLDTAVEGVVLGSSLARGVIRPRVARRGSVLTVTPGRLTSGGGTNPEIQLTFQMAPSRGYPTTVVYSVRLEGDTAPSGGPGSRALNAPHTVNLDAGMDAKTIAHGLGTSFSLSDARYLEVLVSSVTRTGGSSADTTINIAGVQESSGEVLVAQVRMEKAQRITRGLRYVMAGTSRSLATSFVDAVWDRVGAHQTQAASSRLTLGGRTVETSAFASGKDSSHAAGEVARLLGMEAIAPPDQHSAAYGSGVSGDGFDAYRDWVGLPGTSAAFAQRTSFAFKSEEERSAVFWGKGDVRSFEGTLEEGDFSSDGSVTSLMVGVDRTIVGGTAAGIALSSVSGSTDWSFKRMGDGGAVETSLIGATPYVQKTLEGGIAIWGAVGLGTGSAQVTEGADTVETDVDMQMLALGIRGSSFALAGADAALKADAFSAILSADADPDVMGFAKVSGEATRVRVAVEMSFQRSVDRGGMSAYTADIGARSDGGDGESGTGVDLALGFRHRGAGSGLEITGQAGLFLNHGAEDFKETAIGLGVIYDPGRTRRGFHLSLEPSLNAPALGGTDLWNGTLEDEDSPSEAGASIRTRLGYGLGVMREYALATAYGEIEGAEDDARLRIGTELREMDSGLGRFSLDIFGERRDDGEQLPVNALKLEGRLGF